MNHTNWSKTIRINYKSSLSIQHNLKKLLVKHLIEFQNTSFRKQEICWSHYRHATNISYYTFLHTNNWFQTATPPQADVQY